MMLSPKKIILLAAASLVFPMSAVAADSYDQINDKFKVYVGGFWPDVDSKINIFGEVTPPGPPISIEDQLGVDNQKGVAWGGAQWRISQRNSLEFEAFSLARDGGESGTFSPPLQVGDTYIESGAIATSFDTTVSRLTYGFSLKRTDRMDLRVKAGLHIARFDVGLQLSGNVCDLTTVPTMPPGCPLASTGAEQEEVTAPLPHFGVSYDYAISQTVALDLQAIGFAIELDSIDGSLIEVDADLTWQPTRHFGGGIGFRYFNANVKSTGSDLSGEFDFEYVGPVVFIQATF
jgi:opacity protein-like surface antigen